MTQLRLYILDRLRIADGETSIATASASAARVLGYLALHATQQRAVSRLRLARALWPDLEPDEGRRTLSGALYRLHQRLGTGICDRLIARPDPETLALGAVWVDVESFRANVQANSIAQWRAAVDMYTGDLLDDLHDEWLLGSRLMLRDMYCNTLARLCLALDNADDPATALEYAQRWVAADELNEDAHTLVIRLHARLGRPTAALQQYNRLAAMLDREFQSAPQPDVRAFVQRLRAKAAMPAKALRQAAPAAMVAARAASAPAPKTLVVQLARATAPLGRTLTPGERVAVRWTLDAGEHDAALLQTGGKVALRRQRILRLVAEAHAQGATPTDQDLARALGVTERTIIADIATLRAKGHAIHTRRRKQ